MSAALAALALLAYANSFTAGFPLDNKGLILQDARVHAATAKNADLILHHTYWWPVGESGLYRPVTTFSYLFNYAILGNADRPLGYHVVNLALHVANVLLVYLLVGRVTKSSASAIAASWAVHPLSTEAVTNIVGRADLIAGLAVLGGLLMFVNVAERDGRPRFAPLVALAFTTMAGVFAKESAVVVVALMALWYVTFPRPARGGRRMAGVAVAVLVPLAVLWIQRRAVFASAPAAEFPFVDNPIGGASFGIGRLTAIRVAFRYLWLVVWPARLSADYSYAQIPLATGSIGDWIAFAALLAALAGCAVLWRRDRRAFFFAAFSIITFLPASNLLFATGTIMAERAMYLPSVGIIALFVHGVARAFGPAHERALSVALCVIVAALVFRTWTRNNDWHDDLSLWSATVEAAPRSFKAHRGLAETLAESDPTHANIVRVAAESDRAVGVLDALPDAVNDARTYREAGTNYIELGDAIRNRLIDPSPAADAKRAYERAASLLRRSVAIVEAAQGPARASVAADTYRLLSAAYVRYDDPRNAIDTATRARSLDPDNVVGYRQSAAAFLSASRNDEAAVALMTGSLITGDQSLRNELVDLYRQGLDPLRCALVSTAAGSAINPGCQTVRRHACAATADAVQIHERAGRPDQAQRLRDGAARQFGCAR